MNPSRVGKVLIIGGGIAGPVLGMWLRKLGLEVVIAERRGSAALAEGAFLGVAPNGMNVLEELGVAQAVAARGVACQRFNFRNAAGRELGQISREEDPERFGWPLTMLRRGVLHQVLQEEAQRRGVQLQLGKTLEGLEPLPQGITARFGDGSTLEADLLVGCDGLRSTVRALCFPQAPSPVFSGLWDCGGFARGFRPPLEPGVNEMVFGCRAFFGSFLTPQGETWWFHNGPAGAPEDTSPERMRQRLLELHREDPPWVRRLVEATPEVLGPWPLFDLPSLPAWTRGRVCVIGDAAHAMSPSAGQGASLAMEDALVLARCLRDVPTPEQALVAFEQQRRQRVEALAGQARRTSNGKALSNPVALALRDLLLPLFLRLGGPAQDRAYAYRLRWEEESPGALVPAPTGQA